VAGFLLSKPMEWLGAAGLAAALLLPPAGLGVGGCAFRSFTGSPCPGCGLTRSVSSAAHGLWLEAWAYHPLGLMVLLLFVALTVALSLPRRYHQGLRRWMVRRESALKASVWTGLAALVIFGVLRLLAWWQLGWRPAVPL
jgi:hypothetical protein